MLPGGLPTTKKQVQRNHVESAQRNLLYATVELTTASVFSKELGEERRRKEIEGMLESIRKMVNLVDGSGELDKMQNQIESEVQAERKRRS